MARALTIVAALAAACTPATDTPPAPAPTTVAPPEPSTTTTTAPPPSTTATTVSPVVSVPSPPPPDLPPAGAATADHGDVWAALAACESGNRPGLRNPPYSGAFQFIGPTWRSLGYEGEAADYPYEVQLEAAKRLLARSGPGQWPVCGRRVGLGRAA